MRGLPLPVPWRWWAAGERWSSLGRIFFRRPSRADGAGCLRRRRRCRLALIITVIGFRRRCYLSTTFNVHGWGLTRSRCCSGVIFQHFTASFAPSTRAALRHATRIATPCCHVQTSLSLRLRQVPSSGYDSSCDGAPSDLDPAHLELSPRRLWRSSTFRPQAGLSHFHCLYAVLSALWRGA